jgi:hypothetical protein
VRTIDPSVASRNSTRVDTPIVPAQVFPSPTVSFAPSSGTSAVSSRAVASPRAAIAASVAASTLASHASPRPRGVKPCSSSIRTRRAR